MKNILKSWKTTTVGVAALAGLAYNAYTNGGFNVEDFLALVFGVGFIASKDSDQTHSNSIKSITGSNPDPDKEEK